MRPSLKAICLSLLSVSINVALASNDTLPSLSESLPNSNLTCNIDSYKPDGDWRMIVSFYCDKEVDLTQSTMEIEAFPSDAPMSDVQDPSSKISADIDGNNIILHFEYGYKEKAQQAQREQQRKELREDLAEAYIEYGDTYKKVEKQLDELNSKLYVCPDPKRPCIYNPDLSRDEREELIQELFTLQAQDGVRQIVGLKQQLEIVDRLLASGSNVLLKSGVIKKLTLSGGRSKPYSDGKFFEAFFIGAQSFSVKPKPLEFEKPKIDRSEYQKDKNTVNNGIVTILSEAATTDPIIAPKIKSTNKSSKEELAKKYYKLLFFPDQNDYQIFENDNAFDEFKLRKSGCGARKFPSEYNGCDIYYAYYNLVDAYALGHKKFPDKFGAFANTGDSIEDKKQLAAFFANIAQETGGGSFESRFEGVPYAFATITETPCDQVEGICGRYGTNIDNPLIEYYGRGGKQLSYPYNYTFYSKALFGDNRLYDNPELLVYATDPINENNRPGLYGFATSLAYMLVNYTDSCEQGMPDCGPDKVKYFKKPTMVDGLSPDWKNVSVVMNGTKTTIESAEKDNNKDFGEPGFGETINIINGGVECLKDHVHANNLTRISTYIELLIRFGVRIKAVEYQKLDGKVVTINQDVLEKDLLNKPLKFKTGWGNPRTDIYNTSPLMEKAPSDDYTTDWIDLLSDSSNTNKIVLIYADGTKERLDCVGYDHF